jgi:hypothetical protein
MLGMKIHCVLYTPIMSEGLKSHYSWLKTNVRKITVVYWQTGEWKVFGNKQRE